MVLPLPQSVSFHSAKSVTSWLMTTMTGPAAGMTGAVRTESLQWLIAKELYALLLPSVEDSPQEHIHRSRKTGSPPTAKDALGLRLGQNGGSKVPAAIKQYLPWNLAHAPPVGEPGGKSTPETICPARRGFSSLRDAEVATCGSRGLTPCCA